MRILMALFLYAIYSLLFRLDQKYLYIPRVLAREYFQVVIASIILVIMVTLPLQKIVISYLPCHSKSVQFVKAPYVRFRVLNLDRIQLAAIISYK